MNSCLQSQMFVIHCIIFLASMYMTCFDVLQKSPIGGRIRLTMELILIAIFLRILVLDKFYRPIIEAKAVYWLYATDTRALMMQTVQNATIFFMCVHKIHLYFRFDFYYRRLSFEMNLKFTVPIQPAIFLLLSAAI